MRKGGKTNEQDMPAGKQESTHSCPRILSDGGQKKKYKRYCKPPSTYLSLIACIIQESPNKKLTSCQIMDKIQLIIDGDRSGLMNNVRVCLSSNDCFVKVPPDPGCPKSQKFWRFDETRIPPRRLRRHFKGKEHLFPELASRARRGTDPNIENCGEPASAVGQRSCAVKFSSSFSIQSLLKDNNSQSTAVQKMPSVVQASPEGVDQGPLSDWDSHLGALPKSRCAHYAPVNTVLTSTELFAYGISDSDFAFPSTDNVSFPFNRYFVNQPSYFETFFYYPQHFRL